jgi:hypothetical protein
MITLWDRKMGSLRDIERAGREDSGSLAASERYVADCLRVADAYSAGVLIRRGEAAGWRLWLTDDGLVELWAPPKGREQSPSYTMRNETMRRALLARGVKPLASLRHRTLSLAVQRFGMQSL